MMARDTWSPSICSCRRENGKSSPGKRRFSEKFGWWVSTTSSLTNWLWMTRPRDSFDLARIDPKNPPSKPWTIQPTYPELMEAMAEDFRANNFSMHHLMKTIMKSNAYQLSSKFPEKWSDKYTPYYARKFLRVM